MRQNRLWMIVWIPVLGLTGFWLALGITTANSKAERWSPVRLEGTPIREVSLVQEEPKNPAADRPLLLHRFPRSLAQWTFVPARDQRLGETPEDPLAHGVATVGAPGELYLKFQQRGLLVAAVATNPLQTLELRLVARLRGGNPAATPPPIHLTAIPLRRLVDPAELLRQKSLLELWDDPKRKLLCLGKPPPVVTAGPVPHQPEWGPVDFRWRTPLDSRALLLVLDVGLENDFELDVAEIAVTPYSARNFLQDREVREARKDLRTAEERSISPQLWVSAPAFGLSFADTDTPGRCASIRLLGETRSGFLLPPPAVLSLEFSVPAGQPVLEFGRGRLYEPRDAFGRHAMELKLWVKAAGRDEVPLFREELNDEAPFGWRDRRVSLKEFAGESITLRFEAATDRSLDVLAIGSPMLLSESRRSSRPNVVLVSLDTLRADHVQALGYPRPTTPFLDQLIQASCWFPNAYSTSSYTLPSHASMMTGQSPTLHGTISAAPGQNHLSSKRSPLLAEILRQEGYLTAAFTGGNYVGAAFGFAQGFDRYSEIDPLLPDRAPLWHGFPVQNERQFNLAHKQHRQWPAVLDWIRRHENQPFFLFLHTFHIHEYLPSAEYQDTFRASTTGELDTFLAFLRNKKRDPGELDDADLQAGIDAYDSTIREADAAVEQLVTRLRERGLWDNTIFILTSDHGEEFLDHGRLGHGRTLHQEMLRVPLLIHIPGAQPKTVADNVSLIQIAPTVLDLLALDPNGPQDGSSLLPLLQGSAEESLLVTAELNITADNQWRAGIREHYKYVDFVDDSVSEPFRFQRLFNLETDPLEEHDLASRSQKKIELFRQLIAKRQRELQSLIVVDEQSNELSAEMQENLRALGYALTDGSGTEPKLEKRP